MTIREWSHRASPFAHMIFLVGEALIGPIAPSASSPRRAKTQRRSWLDRLDSWAWRQHQKEREAWLAQSQDLSELEARLRALDRGVWPRG